jgi:hypothetical protein
LNWFKSAFFVYGMLNKLYGLRATKIEIKGTSAQDYFPGIFFFGSQDLLSTGLD